MTRQLLRCLLSVLALGGVASAAPKARAQLPEVSAMLERAFALGATPGMAVAVVRDGEIVFARDLGLADVEAKRAVGPSTRFYIASTTKALTALAAAVLQGRGALDLDQTLGAALPGVRLAAPLSADEITLRDLLRHTHGISNDGPVVLRTAYTGQLERPLGDLLIHHRPEPTGRAFVYGNIGYNVFGLVLERRFGGWKEVVDAEVLTPLGMRQTSASLRQVPADQLATPYEESGAGLVRVP